MSELSHYIKLRSSLSGCNAKQFECDNDENMQKWDSGNWFRYKLFENVIEQLKEQNK